MSYRGTTSPNRAFEQTLSSMAERMDRMEKRQRWQGAIRGPYTLGDSGWPLSTGGSVLTPDEIVVDGGVWLVVAFCTWTDTGSDFGYTVTVEASKVVVDEPETLLPIGDIDVPDSLSDGGRFRSATFVGRVEFDAAFRAKFSAYGGPTEGASIGDIRMSVLAFPA